MAFAGPFAITVLTPLLLFHLQQRKGFSPSLALLLTLPLLPASFLLHAQLPSPYLRSFFSFTLCWAIPARLLLVCFRALELPAWSLSRPSHFLLTILLPLRIKGPSPPSADVVSQIRRFLFELFALVSVGSGVAFVPAHARYPFDFLCMYFLLDLPTSAAAAVFHAVYGMELQDTFNSPWLPYSLTDFWGNRWNLHVNALLRQAVYNPTINYLTAGKKKSKEGRRGAKQELELWIRVVGVWVTFLVSGLLHELVWFCILQKSRWSSWENTWFFILHGLVTSAEISCRRLFPGFYSKIPDFLKLVFTMAFLHTTIPWLLFAPSSALPHNMQATKTS